MIGQTQSLLLIKYCYGTVSALRVNVARSLRRVLMINYILRVFQDHDTEMLSITTAFGSILEVVYDRDTVTETQF